MNVKRHIKSAVAGWVRRHVYERPDLGYMATLYPSCAAGILKRDGIVKLHRYFSGPMLENAQHQFVDCLEEFSDHDSSDKIAFHREHAYKFSRFVWDEGILNIARHYWGKPVGVPEFHGYRLLPTLEPIPDGYGAYSWHREGLGKELRAMILLTDVKPDQQCMQYVPGTHDGEEPTESPVWCDGDAGTVILFDSNGLHRGNRNNTAERDVLLPRYVARHWSRRLAQELCREFLRAS